jgi:hypothetical protein
VLEPCMTNTASWAVDDEEHVALIAAHAGTAAGLGAEIGLGEASDDGVAGGVGVGLGAELTIGDRDGLGRAAEVPEPQPASASSAPRANTPSLTGG